MMANGNFHHTKMSHYDRRNFLLSFVGMGLLDTALKTFGGHKLDGKGRYWYLHALVNMYVVIHHFRDVLKAYQDPVNAGFHKDEPAKTHPLMAVCALHALHIVRYKLDRVDWLHHIVMIGLAAPLGLAIRGSTLLGHGLFYFSGLPGALDYTMLVLVRLGMMHSSTERHWNAAINLWLRAPGCLVHCVLCWMAYVETRNGREMSDCRLPSSMYPLASCLLAACSYWNGQYFLNRVIRSSERLLMR